MEFKKEHKFMGTLLNELLSELGYLQSQYYRESADDADLSVAHLLRDAQRRANVRGSYFIRTVEGENSREKPVVHVAEAKTPDEARLIHKQLWNQSSAPFILIALPGQLRVYSGFAYNEGNESVGQVEKPLNTKGLGLQEVANRLQYLRADSIDSGEIWRAKGSHLTKEKRVDRLLLRRLRSLSDRLVQRHHLPRPVAHALIGRFVYLHFLRERDILSDQWLAEVNIDPNTVFSANAQLNPIRRLTDKVDERFNGCIFPIDWASPSSPGANDVRLVARAFAGEDPTSGQMAPFPFDFSFIPIELLSAIYEQFLHDEGKGKKQSAFYTPETLADYLVAEVESVKTLKRGMRVLDPCCGSGIFLVLSYRRLIEREMRHRKIDKLLPSELRDILTSSIFGVERNSEACLVAEFSLILTLLSYIDPPELHRHTKFKFPVLGNSQIFECDFFDEHSQFWKTDEKFDWIVGNPPWKELEPKDEEEQPTVEWIRRAQDSRRTPVARYRTSDAFTWRVRERLTNDGVAGLIIQATSLTNDQLVDYRRAFFEQNTVHRITNFSNLAYILFESAEEPAATIVYSLAKLETSTNEIIHFGPLVANQATSVAGQSSHRRVPWALTICESEIRIVSGAEAAQGKGTTWKHSLWGNPRDRRALQRLRRVLPTTLEGIVNSRGWHLSLGLQLRRDSGSTSDPSQDIEEIKLFQGATKSEARQFKKWFSGLKVLKPKQLQKTKSRLIVQTDWLVRNSWGTFIRQGRVGLDIIRAPHIFLWNDFAAFSEKDFIFRHPKLGLSAPLVDADWLRAVSVLWASSITPYCLFLDLSAGWGISRSTIDLGDTRRMPMPNLTHVLVAKLAKLHRSLAAAEANLNNRADWQRKLDEEVASILKIPANVMLLAREFNEFRLPLVKGKAPSNVTGPPDENQLKTYARRLMTELDGFLQRKSRRHRITVLSAPAGIVATIEIVDNGQLPKPVVKIADKDEQKDVQDILEAAEKEVSQWVYVRRSVRIFAGSKIHLCKPPRRLEWTETQAMLDAADIIAEVVEDRGSNR